MGSSPPGSANDFICLAASRSKHNTCCLFFVYYRSRRFRASAQQFNNLNRMSNRRPHARHIDQFVAGDLVSEVARLQKLSVRNGGIKGATKERAPGTWGGSAEALVALFRDSGISHRWAAPAAQSSSSVVFGPTSLFHGIGTRNVRC
jgi:hypothetical protein